MAKKKTANAPAPEVAPAPIPAVDGYVESAGDDPFTVYIDDGHGHLSPYRSRYARRQMVHVGGVAHQHVGEHEGCWVYRKA